MNEPSIFTRILKGEIKQEIIYKDELCFVITTHEPISAGHILVIPVQQVDHLWDVTDPVYSHLFEVAKKMAHTLKAVYSYERIAMVVEGYGVPHAHIHLFGIDEPLEEVMLYHAAHKKIASPEELAKEAAKLRD